jgi:phosphohistidine phosphatase SixA
LVLAFREDGAIVIERAAGAQAQDGRLFGLRGDLMRALTEMGQATAEELAAAIDADVGTVRNILTSLRRQGRVVVVGRGGQSGKAAVYLLGTPPSAAPSSSHGYSDGVTVVTDAPTEPTDRQLGRPRVTDVLTEFPGVFGSEE